MMNEDNLTRALAKRAADIVREEQLGEPDEAHGRIDIKGSITFPEMPEREVPVIREVPVTREEVVRREIIREIAKEVPAKPFPWGWMVATGSLIFSLVICLSIRR